jgi:chemotaxis signal transduction protein
MHVELRVGEERYALAVADARTVIPLAGVAPLPGAPAALLGVCALHGQLLPVLDLAALLGVSGAAPRRVVISASGGVEAGLAVDDVLDVSELPAHAEPAPAEPLLRGRLLRDEGLVGVLDLPALLDALERELAA